MTGRGAAILRRAASVIAVIADIARDRGLDLKIFNSVLTNLQAPA
jgi:hypothetical protein